MVQLNLSKQRGSRIAAVHARQVLDSRGRPTVEAEVTLEDGSCGLASVPSGASMGKHEALELRDRNVSVHGGFGVLTAIANVRVEIATATIGLDALAQERLDEVLIALDGSDSLERLGSNAVLSTSLAVARAAASHLNEPLYRYISRINKDSSMSLPMPMTNILSGGAHASRGMDFQDFLVIPVGAESYSQALEMISRVRNCASELLLARGLPTLLADEGGLCPGFSRAEESLKFLMEAIERATLRPSQDVAIAIDVAASELFRAGAYDLTAEGRQLTSMEMMDFLKLLARKYPIISIEDGLDQDDWAHWHLFTETLPDIQIVGDDLFATNVSRIAQGIQKRVANATLIKLNQNGTLSGTLKAIAACKNAHYATIVSARSGETEDTFIADFAVGTGAGQIKVGSVRNSERLAKYNQLSRIEETSDLPFASVSGLGGSRYCQQ